MCEINATSLLNGIKHAFSVVSTTGIFSFIAGALTAVFAEPIRQRLYRPKLCVDFENNKHFVAETTYNHGNDIDFYVRGRVCNKSKIMAKDCVPYLVNIEKEEGGKYHPTVYSDSLPLNWSCQPEETKFSPKDICFGVSIYFDIFHTSTQLTEYRPCILRTPIRYYDEKLFSTSGKYKLTIQLSSANTNPAFLCLILDWKAKRRAFALEDIQKG